MKRLIYLCLQATKEGQASYAHVHEIVEGLRRRSWEIQLFEPSYVNNTTVPGPLKRLMAFVAVEVTLLLSAWKRSPHAIYIRNHFATFPIALWARIIRKPVVQEVNGPYEDLFIAWPGTRMFAPLFKWLVRIQLKWANAVVVVTPQLEKWVRTETGNHSVRVIPNGANANLFHPRAPLKYKLPKPYVVFFGALAKWQGMDTLIRAASSSQWPSEVSLVIAGDGVERSMVQEEAARNSRVVYLGPIPYRDMAGIIANSIAGLSPKNNQGGRSTTGLFPLKLFETMACGVPVIVTDFPGQSELVKLHHCGIVIPPDNPDALAQAVMSFYQNPSLRSEMGLRGCKAVEEEHSWDRRAGATDAVLRELLGLEYKEGKQ